jgi:hypothetical protein
VHLRGGLLCKEGTYHAARIVISLEIYVKGNSHFSGHKYLPVMIKTISSGKNKAIAVYYNGLYM